MDEAILCSNDLVESSFVVYMVVSISNLYSFEICIIYNILRYVFGLHGHFKHHFSRSVLPFNSLKMSALASLLLAGTDITASSCALPLLCSANQV